MPLLLLLRLLCPIAVSLSFCVDVYTFSMSCYYPVILVSLLMFIFFACLVPVLLLLPSSCPVSLLFCVLVLIFRFFSVSHVGSDRFKVLLKRNFRM